jgi:hypothetical protein
LTCTGRRTERRTRHRGRRKTARTTCIRFVAHADVVPLLGALRTSGVIGAPSTREDPLAKRRTDRGLRSNITPRRVMPSGRPGCLSPSRTRRMLARRDGSLRPSFRRSRSRRPHFVPRLGTVLCLGLARSRCGHPRVRDSRECRRLCCSLEHPRLGLTTQARHRARPTRPSTRAVCLARTDAGRSA